MKERRIPFVMVLVPYKKLIPEVNIEILGKGFPVLLR